MSAWNSSSTTPFCKAFIQKVLLCANGQVRPFSCESMFPMRLVVFTLLWWSSTRVFLTIHTCYLPWVLIGTFVFCFLLVYFYFISFYLFIYAIHEALDHLTSFSSSRKTISWSRIESPTTPFALSTFPLSSSSLRSSWTGLVWIRFAKI